MTHFEPITHAEESGRARTGVSPIDNRPVATACTIVVTSYNRRSPLAQTLTKLTALVPLPPIIVVVNGSTDGSAAIVRERFPDVGLVELSGNRGAAGRNEGVRAARTRYVAFCDDDCWWRPGAMERAVALLDAYPNVGLLNARVVVRGSRTDDACALMAASPVPKTSHCPGRAIAMFMAGACIMRRQAFLEAGGYHERYHIGAEESLLALDLHARGWEMIYVDDLVLDHHPATTGRVPERRRRLVMRNRLWTAWLRRSRRDVLRETIILLRKARTDASARAALREAVFGLAWVLRERRPIDRRVEAMLDAVSELPA